MKKRLFSLATLMLLAAACTDHIDFPANIFQRQAPIFHAIIEDGENAGSTKVYADEQMRVLWNAGDQISIFNLNTYNQPYRFKGKDGANSGDFEKVSTGAEFSMSGDISHIYSIYPYDEATEVSYSGVLTFSLPSIQHYRQNSFGIGANTMVSATDNNMLRFKNVGGYLSFKLYGENVSVKRITLKGNNHEKLAGLATVTMPVGGTPTIVMQNTATEEITLECDTPVELNASAENYTEFWFVVPPTTFTQGFTVTVTDAQGGVFKKTTQNEVVISRNALSRMEPLQVIPNYDHAFVPFEDANFKAYCVENFDTNHDGEISLSEALTATTINVNNLDISSLAGIECFSNLTALHCAGSFDFSNKVGLGKLTHLDLSKNTKLEELTCSDNNLTSLNISNCPELTILRCHNNKLTTLNVTNNTKLYSISCGGRGGNLLTELDLSNNSALELLAFANNQISSVDLSHNTALTYIDCYNNPLKELDVSNNPMLEHLDCEGLQIATLDVSNNLSLSSLWCRNNPNLSIIWLMVGQIPDSFQSFNYDRKKASIQYKGEEIIFADDNIKAICLANWDSDQNGKLSCDEARAVLSFDNRFTNNSEIKSFPEIIYFTSIKQLEKNAFFFCKNLLSITIPDSIVSIGDSAFYYCPALEYVKFGSNVASIGRAILYPQFIRTLIVDDNNDTFDSRNDCNALIETNSKTLLYGGAGSTIPNGVERISDKAFFCSNKSNISLPSTLKYIGEMAFGGYSGFKTVYCYAPIPPTLKTVDGFSNWHPFMQNILINYQTTVYVPAQYVDAYKEAWADDSITILPIE